jgi:hypothetical protein
VAPFDFTNATVKLIAFFLADDSALASRREVVAGDVSVRQTDCWSPSNDSATTT